MKTNATFQDVMLIQRTRYASWCNHKFTLKVQVLVEVKSRKENTCSEMSRDLFRRMFSETKLGVMSWRRHEGCGSFFMPASLVQIVFKIIA